MRIVPKLTLAFIVSTSAVLALSGYSRIRREVAVFEADRTRDHRLMGFALGEAIAAVWHADGETRALDVLAHVNTPDARIHVRWLWFDDLEAMPHPPLAPQTLRHAPSGVPQSVVGVDDAGFEDRFTYVPLNVAAPRPGALELSESLEGQRRFVRRTILDTILTTATLAIASAVLSSLLGVWIVGRPVRRLADKARRTGQGDFTGPLLMRQNDELALLAREMNMMCEQLILAHERLDAATASRIATVEQLRHADRLTTVGKLASGIAHELGTPLNVVAGRAGMIADGETSPQETMDYARIIVDAADRMARIIRSLLEFARRKGPLKAPQSLKPLLARTLDLLRPFGAKKRVDLTLQVARVSTVDVDLNQFEQVVTNLVVNAIQSMDHDGNVVVRLDEAHIRPPPDIGSDEADYACVRVVDEGAGIDPEHVPHVFEPFFTTKEVGDGTGLGLSVAYGIVKDHGGWIEVSSVLGKGSEFAVYLPLHGAP